MVVRAVRQFTPVVLALTVLATGCYRRLAVSPAEAPLATDIRAHLSEQARHRLAGVLGPERPYLDGRLERWDGETFVLAVPVPRIEGLVRERALIQRIPIGRHEIVLLQIRRMDPIRTVASAAILTAGVALLARRMLSGEAGGGAFPPPGDTGPGEAVFPGQVLLGR